MNSNYKFKYFHFTYTLTKGDNMIFQKRSILILSLFLIIFSMGSAVAANDNCVNDSQIDVELNNSWSTANTICANSTSTPDNEIEYEFSENINASAEQLDYLSGCCSVLLHVRDGYDVFAYRRDSTYAANLYITVTSWYGKTAVKEYKTTNSYFFHTIITLDGWMVGIGGADAPGVVQQLEQLAGNTVASGKITSSTVNSALTLVSKLYGIGHFIIKAPNNVVGYAIVNSGRRSGIFTMSNGQYLAVPNSPSCYRNGFVSTSSPVATTMSLAYNNPWGVNHRNVIAYEYVKTSDLFNNIIKINVYASKSLRSDNIIYRGKFISGSSLPTTPSKRYIGQVVKTVTLPTTQIGYENMIYTYSEILDNYSTTNTLPGSVGVDPWMVTVGDVIKAAEYVKNYVEINHKLPSSVTVNGLGINMPTFLKILTSSILQINNNQLNSLINPKNYGTAPAPTDNMNSGEMSLEEYIFIAQNVKKFMENKGRAPNIAPDTNLGPYITSLGPKFSYQNMIYTYSKILDIYKKTGKLPATIDVKPWKIITTPQSTSVTLEQTLIAAQWVKDYVETNQKLPPYVTINNKDFNLPSFLKLLTTVVQKINRNDFTPTKLTNTYQNPTAPQDTITTGQLTKTTYIEIAGLIQRYMDRNLKAPNYSTNTGLGTYWGYHNIIYTYSKILEDYKTKGTLPTRITIVPWNHVINYAGSFTIQQTTDAATWFKNYIENEQKIPANVEIIGTNLKGEIKPTQITLSAFLKLLTTVVQKINRNDFTPTKLTNTYQNPTAPQDTITTGQMTKTTYIEIAGLIQRYMDRNLKAPNYSTKTGLGTYWGYHNIIYTYSKILDTYSKNKQLPVSIGVSPLIRPVTVKEVVLAAVQVKKYIDINHQLPSSVFIGGKNINMPSFLKLLITSVLQINNKDLNTLIKVQFFNAPSQSQDQLKTRNMLKNEYIAIAKKVDRYMDRNGNAPGYATALA